MATNSCPRSALASTLEPFLQVFYPFVPPSVKNSSMIKISASNKSIINVNFCSRRDLAVLNNLMSNCVTQLCLFRKKVDFYGSRKYLLFCRIHQLFDWFHVGPQKSKILEQIQTESEMPPGFKLSTLSAFDLLSQLHCPLRIARVRCRSLVFR